MGRGLPGLAVLLILLSVARLLVVLLILLSVTRLLTVLLILLSVTRLLVVLLILLTEIRLLVVRREISPLVVGGVLRGLLRLLIDYTALINGGIAL